METYVQIVSQLGFPIFVAVWMLFKGEKDSEMLKETVNELKVAIVELSTYIKGVQNEQN